MSMTESRAPHGTRARYQAPCTDGPEGTQCEACRAANTAYVAERREKRRQGKRDRVMAQRQQERASRQIGLAVPETLYVALDQLAADATERERRHVTVTEIARVLLTEAVNRKIKRRSRT